MPIKIIVLTEYNPSGSRPNFFGRQHLTFDKGGKGVGDFRGIVRGLEGLGVWRGIIVLLQWLRE